MRWDGEQEDGKRKKNPELVASVPVIFVYKCRAIKTHLHNLARERDQEESFRNEFLNFHPFVRRCWNVKLNSLSMAGKFSFIFLVQSWRDTVLSETLRTPNAFRAFRGENSLTTLLGKQKQQSKAPNAVGRSRHLLSGADSLSANFFFAS